MTGLRDEHNVARRWVEAHYPQCQGAEKGRLLLAYGAGMDRGFAEAQEILQQMGRSVQEEFGDKLTPELLIETLQKP